MTDFDYHNHQMKVIARGAKYKKCGSKSKKCSLPSDGMTEGQWKKRNGAVVSVNFNKPMDWKSFKSLSDASKKEYLNGLIDKYGVGPYTLIDMLGTSYTTFWRYCSKLGLNKTSGRMTDEEKKMWREFCGAEECEDIGEMDECENAPADFETPVAESDYTPGLEFTPLGQPYNYIEPIKMEMNKFSLSFSGNLDVNSISNSLRQILGNGRRGVLNIAFELV